MESGVSGRPLGARSVENRLFEETAYNAIKRANRRKWTLIGVISALVIAGLTLLGFNAWRDNRAEAVVKDYVKVEAQFNAEISRFQKELQANPESALKTPDLTQSTQQFVEMAKTHAEHPMGWLAAIRASTMLLEQQKVDEAKALLDPLVTRTVKHDLVQAKVRRALAGIYAEKKEYDQALAHLDAAEKLKVNPGVAEIRLFKGQILYLSGKKEEAKKVLTELSQPGGSGASPVAQSVASEASLWLAYWQL